MIPAAVLRGIACCVAITSSFRFSWKQFKAQQRETVLRNFLALITPNAQQF